MKYYLILQYRRITRKLAESGIPTAIGVPLALAVFVALSRYLFYKTGWADWIYVMIAVSALFRLGDKERNEPLRRIFGKGQYLRVRLLENGLVALPFLSYLIYEKQFFIALGLAPLSAILALVDMRHNITLRIPTPFKQFPFEFIAGFRKSWWLIAIAYFLCAKSVEAHNYGLGLFSMLLIFMTGMSFYVKPERTYFVWIFSLGAGAFLRKKMIAAVICITILSLPVLVALGIAFTGISPITLGVQLLGYLFLCSMVLAKYSAYPNEMSVPQGILYALSLWFPPALLVVIPLFYTQSKRRLEPILE